MLDSLDNIKEKLQTLLRREDASNAIILSAPKGSGKSKIVAEILEKVLVSDDLRNSNLLWVKSEKEKILISQIREVYSFLSKTSYNKIPRIIVIEPADCLNIQSSNALLKILEDCNSNTYFILIAHNIDNLLRTIRSRCINFKLPTQSASAELLSSEMNQCLYITNGVVGSAEILVQESGLEFYNSVLEVLDRFDKNAQILYKFLDKYFARDISDDRWLIFSMLIEHILTKMSKFGLEDHSSIISNESMVFQKLFAKYTKDRKDMICRQVRELISKADLCSLSAYNVALLVFLKIRGV